GIVIEADGAGGSHEYHGAGYQGVGWRTRCAGWQLHAYGFPVGHAFGRGDITGLPHELGELVVGDVGEIHPEAAYPYLMSGAFLGAGELMVAAHEEGASGNPGHVYGTVLAVADDDDGFGWLLFAG